MLVPVRLLPTKSPAIDRRAEAKRELSMDAGRGFNAPPLPRAEPDARYGAPGAPGRQ